MSRSCRGSNLDGVEAGTLYASNNDGGWDVSFEGSVKEAMKMSFPYLSDLDDHEMRVGTSSKKPQVRRYAAIDHRRVMSHAWCFPLQSFGDVQMSQETKTVPVNSRAPSVKTLAAST